MTIRDSVPIRMIAAALAILCVGCSEGVAPVGPSFTPDRLTAWAGGTFEVESAAFVGLTSRPVVSLGPVELAGRLEAPEGTPGCSYSYCYSAALAASSEPAVYFAYNAITEAGTQLAVLKFNVTPE